MSDMILKEKKEISNEDMLKSLMESQTIMNMHLQDLKLKQSKNLMKSIINYKNMMK